jgi:hypothetical protein
MGRIVITAADEQRELPLAATTVLGRHSSCTWVLSQPEIPTFWVELRWTSAGWTWRELGGDARGPRKRGAKLGQDWWMLERGQRLNGRSVQVELIDATPPQRFVVDIDSGAVLLGDALHAVIAYDAGRPLPAGWEQAEDPPAALRDGDLFGVAGRRLRYHAGVAPQATAQRQLDLLRHTCRLELGVEDGRPVLHVWDGPVERKARGAPLWSLVPYLEARISDTPRDGWLSLDEAHARWRELCPDSDSGPDRVGQDRSRSCRALHALGVVNPHSLFARRRIDDHWQVRIALEPEQLSVRLGDDA